MSSPAAWSSPAAITGLPRSSSPQLFDDKVGIVNGGASEDGYGGGQDPMDGDIESNGATLIDPDLGGHRASSLVRTFP